MQTYLDESMRRQWGICSNEVAIVNFLTIALMCDYTSLAKITTKPSFDNAKCKFYHEPIGHFRYIKIQLDSEA